MPFIFKGLVDTLGETSQAAAAAAVATGEAVAGGAPPEAAVAVPFAMVLGYGIARSTASGAQEVNYERWGLSRCRSCRFSRRSCFATCADTGKPQRNVLDLQDTTNSVIVM